MSSKFQACPHHKTASAYNCKDCLAVTWEERKMILDAKIQLVNQYIIELKGDIEEIRPSASESELNTFKMSLLQKKLDICEKQHRELKSRAWMDSLWAESLHS
jgi:hypothetical protein